MSLHRISTSSRSQLYLLHVDKGLPAQLNLVSDERMTHFADIGSSLFLRSEDHRLLAKFASDKYTPGRSFGKWLGRDILSKRLVGHYDASSEYESASILASCGQRVIPCHGYGMALNPFNRWGSVYIMSYMESALSGKEYFLNLQDDERMMFLQRFVQLAIDLAKRGFYHRDFHYGNILLNDHNEFVWIDTHVKRLPARAAEQGKALYAMISPTKLGGEQYAHQARELLARAFPSIRVLQDVHQ